MRYKLLAKLHYYGRVNTSHFRTGDVETEFLEKEFYYQVTACCVMLYFSSSRAEQSRQSRAARLWSVKDFWATPP